MKKTTSLGGNVTPRLVDRTTVRKTASLPSGKDYSVKVAPPSKGGQALIKSIDELQQKLIRQLS